MTFEDGMRSLERAVRAAGGTATLHEDGVVVVLRIQYKGQPTAISRLVPWHDLAMARAPMGQQIVTDMVTKLKLEP